MDVHYLLQCRYKVRSVSRSFRVFRVIVSNGRMLAQGRLARGRRPAQGLQLHCFYFRETTVSPFGTLRL
jgi:hypothetical protein